MNSYWHWWKLVTNANPTFQPRHSTRPLLDTRVLATTRRSYYVDWRSLRRVSSVFSIALTCGKWAWCRTLSSDYDREWVGCLLYDNIWFWLSIRIFASQNRGVCTEVLQIYDEWKQDVSTSRQILVTGDAVYWRLQVPGPSGSDIWQVCGHHSLTIRGCWEPSSQRALVHQNPPLYVCLGLGDERNVLETGRSSSSWG